MAARLDSLCDHRVDTGSDSCLPLLERSDLDQNLQPLLVRSADVRLRIAPEQDDGRRAACARGSDCRPEVLDICSLLLVARLGIPRDDQVDPERRVCEPARARALLLRELGRHPARSSDHPEPAGPGNCSGELRAGTGSETDRQDRPLDPQDRTQRRPKLLRHRPIIRKRLLQNGDVVPAAGLLEQSADPPPCPFDDGGHFVG